MSLKPLFFLLPGLFLSACASQRSPIAPGAVPKDHGAIGATEGPAWHDGSLYFTDGKHINRMGPDGKTTVFRHNASNGLLFDREGRLVACESGLRRVTRTEKDGSITVLADRFRGKRFNTPNDLCMDSKGRIYFTDASRRFGAKACLLGRATAYALAADGQHGVENLLDIFAKEMRVAMTLTSVAKVADITGELLAS